RSGSGSAYGRGRGPDRARGVRILRSVTFLSRSREKGVSGARRLRPPSRGSRFASEYANGSTALTTSSGTRHMDIQGTSLSLTCPSGDQYHVADPMALIGQCDNDVGGDSFGASGQSVNFTLLGGSDIDADLFHCALP
ncbi:MAG: hypothetical protein ACK2U9_05335, partial [Anaerolineae bacterium]